MSDMERKFELAKLEEDDQLDEISKIIYGLKEKSQVHAIPIVHFSLPCTTPIRSFEVYSLRFMCSFFAGYEPRIERAEQDHRAP
jgi:hypothetical protein